MSKSKALPNRVQMPKEILNIYDYVNYRLYLKDFLAKAKKEKLSGFSHKVLLSHLGITSTGFISNLTAGRKNLTPIQIVKLAKGLKLNKAETGYFEAMVYFTQAKVIEEKNEYFNRLVTLQKIKMKLLDKGKMSLFSKWYFVVIRELLSLIDAPMDAKSIAAALEPAIKPAEAEEALEYLSQLGLIKQNDTGRWVPIDSAISTGDEVRSLHLTNFQLKTLELAAKALQNIPAKERDFSVLTMTLTPDTFRLMKYELQHMRKRLAKLVVEEQDPNRVYQMNFQFFPVSKPIEGGGNV